MRPPFFKSTFYILFLITVLNACSKKGSGPLPAAGPGITGLNKTQGSYNSFVNINGRGFGSDLKSVQVFFNDKPAYVFDVTPTLIKVTVPLDAGTGAISVVVDGTKLAGPVFTYVKANIIYKLAGNPIAGFTNGKGNAAQFQLALGIAVDKANNIYVADNINSAVRKITPDGVVSTYATFDFVKVITIDDADNLYIAYSNKIEKINPAGQISPINYIDHAGGASGLQIAGMAVDNSGNIYVSDQFNNRILKRTTDGILTVLAGSPMPGNTDGTGAAATFYQPTGIVPDKMGNLYVCDRPNLIRKITPGGVVTTYAGGKLGLVDGVGTAAGFKLPVGITIDDNGDLYVADSGNNAIRKIDINQNVTTL